MTISSRASFGRDLFAGRDAREVQPRALPAAAHAARSRAPGLLAVEVPPDSGRPCVLRSTNRLRRAAADRGCEGPAGTGESAGSLSTSRMAVGQPTGRCLQSPGAAAACCPRRMLHRQASIRRDGLGGNHFRAGRCAGRNPSGCRIPRAASGAGSLHLPGSGFLSSAARRIRSRQRPRCQPSRAACPEIGVAIAGAARQFP